MTYEELVDKVTDETVEILEAIYSDGFQITDLTEVIEAGVQWSHAWNAANIENDDFTTRDLLFHVISRLPSRVVNTVMPLPQSEIPEN